MLLTHRRQRIVIKTRENLLGELPINILQCLIICLQGIDELVRRVDKTGGHNGVTDPFQPRPPLGNIRPLMGCSQEQYTVGGNEY